jgi:beta-carotene 15,15'-monooxygenase
MSDICNMTLYKIGTNVCVAGESCYFRDLDEKKLEVGEKHDTNKCYGLNFVSPHLLTDEKTGTTYTVGSSFLTGLKYNFVKIPAMTGKPTTKDILKKAQVFASISSQVNTLLSMHHSFGMTSRFLVFVEQPYVLNVTKILGGVLTKGQCFLDWLEWRGDLTNRFYLIDKETGKVHKTEVVTEDPFMFTHFINCYEEDNQVVVDLLCFDNGDFFEANFLKNLLATNKSIQDTNYAKAQRFVIPLIDQIGDVPEGQEQVTLQCTSASAMRHGKKLVLKPEALTKKGLELPCLNKSFIGKKYKYFYCTGNTSPEGYFENSVIKMDLETKTLKVWQGSEYCFAGEPIFIRNPDANDDDEDNGVILTVVVDSRKESNDYLLFIDAKTFKEIGRATFNGSIPFLIHGLYIPS